MTTGSSIERALRIHRSGDLAEAGALYAEILDLDPDHAEALHLMGVIAFQRRDFTRAEQYIRKALHNAPEYPAALANLGLLLMESRRWADAIECFHTSLRIEHAQPGVWSNLGMALVQTGKYQEGAQACRTALNHDSGSADAYCNLGNALRAMGLREDALQALRKAITLRPAFAEAQNSLGNVLAEMDMLTSAMFAYETAREIKPEYVSPITNLAKLHREQGMLDQAEKLYRRALSIDPQSAEAHWGLSFVHLLQGDWVAGWREYEWRSLLASPPEQRVFDTPLWDGTQPDGRTILVQCEQGLGDAIQFIRYVPLLTALGAKVYVEAPPVLVRLFEAMPGVKGVIARGAPFPHHDVRCALLSLPHFAGTTPCTVPACVPYLSVPEATTTFWRERLAGDPAGLRIGLAWSGSRTHDNDRRRSLESRLLDPILALEGAVFYNLQIDRKSIEQCAEGRPRFIDHSGECGDVLATAGLINQLDLVITVDTMVAHLAGALGKPVWVLLPFAPDWRWMLEREDSPWYPDMRLFRQREPGDWNGVVQRVEHVLGDVLRSRTPAFSTGNSEQLIMEAISIHRHGDLPRALEQYEQILRYDPDNSDALYLLSVVCRQMGYLEKGLSHVRRLLESHPRHAEGWNNLGNLLRQCHNTADAEQAFRAALSCDPEYADGHYNLGSCLCDVWRLEEAEDYFRKALVLGASPEKTHNNIGLVCYRRGRIDGAIVEYTRALGANPDCVEAHWNLAHALLHQGNSSRGWREFEWRWRKPEFQKLLHRYKSPRWDGGPLRGRTVLVWAEQGYGDTLFFLRYLAHVTGSGGRVIVECPTPLHRLVRRVPGVDHVIGKDDPLPPHDVHIPLLSVPLVAGETAELDHPVPYLSADHGGCTKWGRRLDGYGTHFRIGIVWSGSPTNPEGRYRSVPLDELVPLTRHRDVLYVSLQKGEAGQEFGASPFAAAGMDWTSELVDFHETAALINCLDLVITVDTAVAHLAGGMGKEVWLLLSNPHDWRWGERENSSDRYPAMRLLRQRQRGVWKDVVEECTDMLANRLSFRAKGK